MFANFFGIVIISASALLIAGLILRPTPDLPATMNLGLVDKIADTAMQASTSSSDTAASSTDGSSSADTVSTSGDAATQDASGNTTDSATQVVANTATQSASGDAVKSASQAAVDNTKAAAQSTVVVPTVVNKQYFEIRKRAIDLSGSAATRANKSDAGKYKD